MDVLSSLNSIVVLALPLLIVALAGVFSERSGIINIALEGIMCVGATTGFLALYGFNKLSFPYEGLWQAQLCVLLSLIIAMAVSGLYALLLAFAAIKLKANQTIIGTALNILPPAIGFCICWSLIVVNGTPSTTINLPTWAQITPESLGVIDTTNWAVELFLQHLFLTTPIIMIVFVVMTLFLYKTKIGLRLRSCGENPQAADSVGINVNKMRYLGTFISGLLGGLGGMQYAMFSGSSYLPESGVAGYGFLALALMIFGNRKPIRILIVSLFFSTFIFLSSQQILLQSWFPAISNLNGYSYIFKMMPYLLTLIVLIFTSKKSQAPKAEGIPYDKATR